MKTKSGQAAFPVFIGRKQADQMDRTIKNRCCKQNEIIKPVKHFDLLTINLAKISRKTMFSYPIFVLTKIEFKKLLRLGHRLRLWYRWSPGFLHGHHKGQSWNGHLRVCWCWVIPNHLGKDNRSPVFWSHQAE